MIEVISDIIVGLSAVVVAVFAALGLNAWRRELTGKAKFELAKRLVFLAIKLKAGFEWARFPVTSSVEYAGRERGKDEPPEESKVLDEWYVRRKRLELLPPDLTELYRAAWEAEVLLDEDRSGQVEEVVKVFKEAWATLSTAVIHYFHEKHQRVTGKSYSQDTEWLRKLECTIYGLSGDEFSRKVDEAVDRLKEILRGCVR